MNEVSEHRYSPYSANTFTGNNGSWNRDAAVPPSHGMGSNLHSLVPSTVTVHGQGRDQLELDQLDQFRTEFINSQNEPATNAGGFHSTEIRASGRPLYSVPRINCKLKYVTFLQKARQRTKKV
jgi:hypothetical protein